MSVTSVRNAAVPSLYPKYGKKAVEGGVALAETILDVLDHKESHFAPIYPSEMSLKDKIATIAKEIYGAADVSYAPAAEKELKLILRN